MILWKHGISLFEDLTEHFGDLVKDILDLAGSADLGVAEPEYVADKAEEFIEVHGLFYCLLRRARSRRNVKNISGDAKGGGDFDWRSSE